MHAVVFCRLVDEFAGRVFQKAVQHVRSAQQPMRFQFARCKSLGQFVGDERPADRHGPLSSDR